MSLFLPALEYDEEYEIDGDFYRKLVDPEYLKKIAVLQ